MYSFLREWWWPWKGPTHAWCFNINVCTHRLQENGLSSLHCPVKLNLNHYYPHDHALVFLHVCQLQHTYLCLCHWGCVENMLIVFRMFMVALLGVAAASHPPPHHRPTEPGRSLQRLSGGRGRCPLLPGHLLGRGEGGRRGRALPVRAVPREERDCGWAGTLEAAAWGVLDWAESSGALRVLGGWHFTHRSDMENNCQ